ncbi:DNA cytosine methyltransferase [Kitasatospora indigofera]|uniref:DNA cytosine methyltransferase n=1 Tax=Kitasatospora indigofera TaxID=67307 RepID=UPI001E2D3920|nr:DNA cytosine methyltransferase [Kitasatospora indigofera]
MRSKYLPLEAHPDACTPDTFREWLKQRRPEERLAVDLFSGAGGLSLGLKRAGWTVAAAVDNNDRALETHRHNFPGMSLKLDLGSLEGRNELLSLFEGVEVDLVAGGPPCQPFSRAGSAKIRDLVAKGIRDEHDVRKELWRAYIDIVLALRPRAVLMENVPDMGLADDFRVVRIIEQKLEDAKYVTQVHLVDTWKFGVPQHRRRLILQARRDSTEFRWPKQHANIVTLRDAISDLPPVPVNETGSRETPYARNGKLSRFAADMRKGAPRGLVHDHMTRPVRKDDAELFDLMDSKSLYSDLYQKFKDDPEKSRLFRYDTENFTDKYNRLGWDELSRTITAHIAKDGYWYIHPDQPRTLTVREAARIQTFPDNFRFAGMRSDAFRQIGNAVPPYLGEAAARALWPHPEDAASGPLQPFWGVVRRVLTDWATEQRAKSDWISLPGPRMGVPQAAVAALVGTGKANVDGLTEAMTHVDGLPHLTRAAYTKVVQSAQRPSARRALERLEKLAGKRKVWEDRDGVADQLGLKPNEKAVFRLLLDNDLLMATQGPIRVAERVAGIGLATDDTSANALNDGRINLAKLVGAGDDAPLRMAAVRLLSLTYCRAGGPACGGCPLREMCATQGAARAGQSPATPFSSREASEGALF